MSFAHFTNSGFEANCEAGFANLQKECPCGVNWIAVGGFSNYIMTSYDGISWNSVLINWGPSCVVYNGISWVIGGVSGDVAYSSDGKNWSYTTSGLRTLYDIAWNGSYFLAVGAIGDGTVGAVAYSINGINWIIYDSIAISIGLGVAWNGSYWICVGRDLSENKGIFLSSDGINWTQQSYEINGQGIAWNGSLWVAVGTSTALNIITSPDGINWTGQVSTLIQGFAVAWNGSLWVAVGQGASYPLVTSPDGINWTERSVSIGTIGSSVAWNGALWICGGSSLDYSVDGINWISASAPDGAGDIASISAPNLYPPIGV